ncbi:hypothetical protein BASA81_008356 [Batrachochytrium salamandrivorans]|nr:hypothetical protein BASA81_008356 [Batrachochytrium salamandrivorans]
MSSYNTATKILTLSTTSSESFKEITFPIDAQKMILREFRADMNVSGKTSFHRVLNLEIGNIVGTHFVNDDSPGACYFQLGLSHNNVWTHPADGAEPQYDCESTVGNPSTPLTMSGDLSKNFYLRVYDDVGKLISADEMKYLRSFTPSGTFSGAPDGNTHTFKIPPAGIHYLGMVRYEGTKSFALNEAPTFSVYNTIRNVQFFSNGQPILTMTGEAFKITLMNNKAPLQEFCYRYSRALAPVTEEPLDGTAVANANFVTYLPLFASWYQEIEKALNTTKSENIEISITYKSGAESGFGINSLSKFSPKFENFTYMPDAETYNKMITKDYSSSILMNLGNSYTEQTQLISVDPANVTRLEFQSKATVAAFKSHIFIAKNNSTANTGFYKYGCPHIPIAAVSVGFSGDYYTKAMLNFEQAVRGNSSHIVAPIVTEAAAGAGGNLIRTSAIGFNENQCYTIDWSLLCDRDDNTGMVALGKLGNPIFSIDIAPYVLTPAGGAAAAEQASSYNLYVVHEFWNIGKTDPGTGTISIAANT